MQWRTAGWMLVPLTISVIALLILWGRSSTGWDVFLLFIVVLSWGVTALLSQAAATKPRPILPSADSDRLIVEYHGRLLGELQQRHVSFESRRAHVSQVFLTMSRQLAKAVDLSRSTGLLAANAMMAATRCGEVGRGFVTVSKELSGISDTAEQDLQTLYLMVTRLQARLSHATPLLEGTPDSWLASPTRIRHCVDGIHELHDVLSLAAGSVQQMLQRYQDEARMDVRWLQLGDSVRRVLLEIGDNLSALAEDMNRIVATARILALSQPLTAPQRIELSRIFTSADAVRG